MEELWVLTTEGSANDKKLENMCYKKNIALKFKIIKHISDVMLYCNLAEYKSIPIFLADDIKDEYRELYNQICKTDIRRMI